MPTQVSVEKECGEHTRGQQNRGQQLEGQEGQRRSYALEAQSSFLAWEAPFLYSVTSLPAPAHPLDVPLVIRVSGLFNTLRLHFWP